MKKTCTFIGAALLASLIPAAAFAGASPRGDAFQVNTVTSDVQLGARAAAGPDGNFTVVWMSGGFGAVNGPDGSGWGIEMRRFASDGTPLADEQAVNTYTTEDQVAPAVAAQPNGDVVVVWTSEGGPGSDVAVRSIQARRFASLGTPVGDQFQVNTYTTSGQESPGLAVASSGDFVIVWDSNGSAGSDVGTYAYASVQARRFDSAGTALGPDFQVNTYTTYSQSDPAVGVGPTGDFVVVWSGRSGGPDPGVGVQGQAFAADGSPVGGEFQVNTYTTYSAPGTPEIAIANDGSFVVVWQSGNILGSGPDGSSLSVQVRRFDSAGMPIGDEFQANTYTTDRQQFPAVAMQSSGAFVVSWSSYGSNGTDTSDRSIQLQRFDQAGGTIGGEYQVNRYTPGHQVAPTLALIDEDELLVAWDSESSVGDDDSDRSIQAQRLRLRPVGGCGAIVAADRAAGSTVGTSVLLLAALALIRRRGSHPVAVTP